MVEVVVVVDRWVVVTSEERGLDVVIKYFLSCCAFCQNPFRVNLLYGRVLLAWGPKKKMTGERGT